MMKYISSATSLEYFLQEKRVMRNYILGSRWNKKKGIRETGWDFQFSDLKLHHHEFKWWYDVTWSWPRSYHMPHEVSESFFVSRNVQLGMSSDSCHDGTLTEKLMPGRWHFLPGMAYVQVRTVSFRECNRFKIKPALILWWIHIL